MINMVVAAVAVVPVLVPQLGLPLKLQMWPGTWMFMAYFGLLAVGVLGVLAWSVIYYLLPRLFGRSKLNRTLSVLHIGLFEIGILGATSLIGIFPGYVGATLIRNGFAEFVVTRVIEWSIIPIGVFIAVTVMATLTGVVNVIMATED